MRNDRFFKLFSISLLSLWLVIFALIPLLSTLGLSFLSFDDNHFFKWPLTLANYGQVLDPLFLHIISRSLYMSIFTTLICLLLAYPFAYILAQLPAGVKPFLLCLMIIPFWTSSIIRIYAIMALIKTRGILNTVLLHVGIIHQPLHLLFTQYAVFIGLVYNLLPYMILPIYTNIDKLDKRLIDAARDLGANRFTIFLKILLPITLPGILAGVILVFLPTMTLFFIPDLLGGAQSMLLGNLINVQMLTLRNWPLGCATSMVLTCLMFVFLGLQHYIQQHSSSTGKQAAGQR